MALSQRLGLARNTVQARLARLESDDVLAPLDRRVRPGGAGLPAGRLHHRHRRPAQPGRGQRRAGRHPRGRRGHRAVGRRRPARRGGGADADDLWRITEQVLAIPGVQRTDTALALRRFVDHRVGPLLERAAACEPVRGLPVVPRPRRVAPCSPSGDGASLVPRAPRVLPAAGSAPVRRSPSPWASLLAGCTRSSDGSAAASTAPTSARGHRCAQRPCPDGSDFECMTLARAGRPLHSRARPPGRSPSRCTAATSTRGRAWSPTGGPGSSGIAVADRYTGEHGPGRSPTTTTSSSSTSAGSVSPTRSAATTRWGRRTRRVDSSADPLAQRRLRPRRPGASSTAASRRPGSGDADAGAVRDAAGRGGPRGVPLLAGRRPAGPLRRELRDPVPADLRRRPPRPRGRRCCSTVRRPRHRPARASWPSRPRPTATCWPPP